MPRQLQDFNRLLLDEPPLQVLPSLAKAIGLSEAIVLQQLHYRLRGNSHEQGGRRWYYQSYEGWVANDFPFWSPDAVKRVFTSLEHSGLVLSAQLHPDKRNRQKWYTIAYESIPEPSAEYRTVSPPIVEALRHEAKSPDAPGEIAQCNSAKSPDVYKEQRILTETIRRERKQEGADAQPAPGDGLGATKQAMWAAYYDVLKATEPLYKETNPGETGKAVNKLLELGCTPRNLQGAFLWYKTETFWADKHLKLSYIVSNYAAWLQAGSPVPEKYQRFGLLKKPKVTLTPEQEADTRKYLDALYAESGFVPLDPKTLPTLPTNRKTYAADPEQDARMAEMLAGYDEGDNS
jgi:hypothetical protein